MSTNKFAFAVIAGETLENVENSLRSICAQEIGPDVERTIFLAHDNPLLNEEWVTSILKDEDICVTLLPVDLENAHSQARDVSMLAAIANAIPEDVAWVWTIADDAALYSKLSLQQVNEHLSDIGTQKISFIHACLSQKSYDTGYAQIDSVSNLCEMHGYFEVLGTPSSLVLAADIFKVAFGRHLAAIAEQARKKTIRITPFTYCQLLYIALAEETGMLIDAKLISQKKLKVLQDGSEISESKQMFLVAGELVELAQHTNEDTKWDMHFFRFGQKSIWTELLAYQSRICKSFDENVSEQNADLIEFIDNWQVLLSLGDHISSKEVASIIRNIVTNGIKYTLELLSQEDKSYSLRKLDNFFKAQLVNDLVYPTTLMRPDHMMQLMRKSA